MWRAGAVVLAPAAMLVAAAGPAAAAADSCSRSGPAAVRVINADPTTPLGSVDVNGRPVAVRYGTASQALALADGTLRVVGTVRTPEPNSLTTVVRTPSGPVILEACFPNRPDPGKRHVRAVVASTVPADVAVTVDGVKVGTGYTAVGGSRAAVAVNGVAAGSVDLAGSAPSSYWTVAVAGGGDYGWTLAAVEDAVVVPSPPDPSVPIETGLDAKGGGGAAVLAALLVGAVVRRRRAGLVVLLAVALAAAACNERPQQDDPNPGAAAAPVIAGRPVADLRVGRVDRVVLAPIGLDRPLAPVSSDVALLREVLRRDQLGWLTSTAAPGSIGLAVAVGHRTGRGSAPGVFERLADVRRGARLTTYGEAVVEWVAVDVAAYPKGALPEGFFGPRPVPTLALISCTGFDGAAHRQNLIVSFVPAQLLV
jgi:uncharacterized protein (TIGR03382 family)